MKKFNREINTRFGQVKPESLNDNTNTWINLYNGHLDNQNLPINVIENNKLTVAGGSETVQSPCTVTKWNGVTQRYGEIKFLTGQEGGINDWLSSYDVELKTDNWTGGWNRLSEWIPNHYLQMDVREGMITGQFNINWWYGLNTYKSTSSASASHGEEWYIRWGLFMNDILIAETGNCYPRGENTCVPFKLPVGSQQLTFDLRWQARTNNPDAATMFAPSDDVSGYIQLLGANIWINNTIR